MRYLGLEKLALKATLTQSARKFLESRDLDPNEAIKLGLFSLSGLRVSSDTLNLMKVDEVMCVESLSAFLQNWGLSIIVPMVTMSNEVVGFQARATVAKKDMWFTTTYSDFYQPLTGLKARFQEMIDKKAIVLVEGIFDLLALTGCPVPVASVQGSTVSRRRMEWLSRFVDTVIVCFDNDRAGRLGYIQIEKHLRVKGIKVKRVSYSGNDPNEMLSKYGKAARERVFDQIAHFAHRGTIGNSRTARSRYSREGDYLI